MTPRLARISCGLLIVGLTGCEAAKSSNPTAPTVAGPIAGVTINPPVLLEPAQGFRFKESEQPIRLVARNATTTGVRPLTYTFEVASDSGFNTKLFARSGVQPGDGQTSVQIDRLEIGRSYYWRARAEDGANTGAFSTAGFEIFPKAAINPPTLIAPVNNADAGSLTPGLSIQNATTVGPVGGIVYEFQVAADQAFTRLFAAGIINEGGGTTTFNSSALSWATTYFWRVRASDGESTSGWTPSQVFRTPAAPVVKPPTPTTPSPGGGGTGSCDALASGNRDKFVECIWNSVPRPTDEYGAFEVTKRVAWALRGEGAGLLIKEGGENVVTWQGHPFSASRICYPDGHIYKVIGDAGPGGANSPGWSDNGFVDKKLYVAAIDPSKK